MLMLEWSRYYIDLGLMSVRGPTGNVSMQGKKKKQNKNKQTKKQTNKERNK